MSLIIEELTKQHNRSLFDCGVDELNKFLQTQARQKNSKNISKTNVLCLESDPQKIIGYYTLTGYITKAPENHKIYKSYPEPLSGVKLARIAIDRKYHSSGYGDFLLQDAILKTIIVSEQIATIGLFVDPKHPEIEPFYKRYGFIHVRPDDPNSYEMWLPTNTCLDIFND